MERSTSYSSLIRVNNDNSKHSIHLESIPQRKNCVVKTEKWSARETSKNISSESTGKKHERMDETK